MTAAALVVLTTLANDADARALVTALVAARLVACGTLLPGARSIYRWEGQVTEEAEVVVLLKTDASRWEALCAAVRERHPYQVPELLALPVARGLEQYLAWLTSEAGGWSARGGPGQRPAGGRAGRPARRRDALPRGAAGLRARAARRPDPRRGAHGPRRAAFAPRVVERSGAAPAARVGGRPGPGGRLVLSG